MKTYKVEKPITMTAGVVCLNENQAKRREFMLRKTGKAHEYEVMTPIQLKVGEVVGIGEASKAYLASLSEVEQPKAKAGK